MSFSYAKFIARRGGVVLASGPPTIQNGGSIAKQPIKLSKLKKITHSGKRFYLQNSTIDVDKMRPWGYKQSIHVLRLL